MPVIFSACSTFHSSRPAVAAYITEFSSHQATNSIWSSDRPDVVVSAVASVLGLGTRCRMSVLTRKPSVRLLGGEPDIRIWRMALMTHTSYPWSAYREGLLTERQTEVNEKQSEQLPGR